ncbi:HEAT repeat domain-containing protein [Chamaesiphon sp. VAR_48_metabat_135_sub]|uniref:HEAT repeat domain-containing protein n=1 Tax=Chamaesiphon sp. VAR_48_metabat_135_sub TaxID=2964699 RepID=UPI00286C5458|nr:HEAT repeat domain-containing protein [Chamaesiphon sp. VAR_48_metabat_135_sub]
MPSVNLKQAIAAADSGMWSIVVDCLQTLSLQELDRNETVLDLALQVLIQGDIEQQWDIAKIIPKLGEIAIQPLLEIVNDRDLDLEDRWFGARILGAFKQPQVVTALVALIQQNEDPELTTIASGALTKIGIPAIATMTDLLATPDRGIAIAILAQIRHSQTIEPLIQVIDDPDPQLRTLIVEALGSFHDPRIPPRLLLKLTDVAASVRQATVVALSLRGDLAVELDLLEHLKPRLFDLNLDVCKSTALGLARLPDPEVVGTLAEVLASINTPNELKSSVILALGWIGTQPAIDSLIAALENRSIDLAPEIVTAIGKTERERVYASQRLVAYLNEKELYKGHPAIVKQEIAAALGNLGNINTVTDLVRLLKDPDDRVKLHVMTAISKLTSIVTVEMLPKKPEFPPDCGNQ